MSRRRTTSATLAAGSLLVLGGCATGTPAGADRAEIATWTQHVGIAPELVYVTELDGFDLATQSVGVVGDDGMSAMYVRAEGDASGTVGTVLLTTSRHADPSSVPCADLVDPAPGLMACAVERGEAVVQLAGEGVDAATLRAAAEAVRVPAADELGALFADLPVIDEPVEPVERGDLPPGDGAPDNEPGLGG